MAMFNNNNLIQAVREMLERNWDVYTIASRLNVDPSIIQQILDILT